MALVTSPSGFDDLVVTGTSQGITDAAAIASIPKGTLMARIEHRSGGKVNWHTADPASTTVLATGGQGEGSMAVGDVIEVWGQDDLTNWRVILQTGEPSATVAIICYGEGGNN